MNIANDHLEQRAANDAPSEHVYSIALRDLTVLLARAHVRSIAGQQPANAPHAPEH